jgi:hypothetical protein
MKIYVLGSNTFVREMVQAKNDLIAMGLAGWIHPDYEAYVEGTKNLVAHDAPQSEKAEMKRTHNYFRVHYQHILESDAVLIVNGSKNGVDNYIGGNALIEMGQAYVNDKSIFLLHDIPQDFPYTAEIVAMDPICLHGQLRAILTHN